MRVNVVACNVVVALYRLSINSDPSGASDVMLGPGWLENLWYLKHIGSTVPSGTTIGNGRDDGSVNEINNDY